ncbi:MAG: hypothetical protein SOI66_05245 [Bifidobacterium sp.]|jgi:hypothetical protein
MAAKFPDSFIAEALERSLRNSKDLKAVNSVVVATARSLAIRLDYLFANDFVTSSGKFDNVTVPTFLKYLQALGLTLDMADAKSRASTKNETGPTTRVKNDFEDYLKKFG